LEREGELHETLLLASDDECMSSLEIGEIDAERKRRLEHEERWNEDQLEGF